MPPLNSPKTNVVYEGITDVNKCVAIVEHEFERLESMAINVYHQNKEINKLYEPTEFDKYIYIKLIFAFSTFEKSLISKALGNKLILNFHKTFIRVFFS
jgi:hypothetical protein